MSLILHKLLLALWLCLSASVHVHPADDSLKPGDTLNFYSPLLYSKNRRYFIEFYPVGIPGEIEDFTYLAVFNNERAVVWEGNREQPVGQRDVVLSLNFSGVLKIESQRVKKPIILYSPPQPINNTVATLLDTGNFVLQQLHSNGTNTLLWQSFDYLTDTLIPTMKLGVNHKTGHNWSLVSQLTDSRATAGAFRFEWDPKEQELIIRRRGKVCWKSGKMKNNKFEHIPEDAQSLLKYNIVSNDEEDSFSFTSTNENLISWWTLSYSGRLLYNGNRYIARADLCFGYNNTEGGCQRWQHTPKCRSPGDVFTKKSLRFNYQNVTYDQNQNISHSDCEAACWSDCDCNGFQEMYLDGTGCSFYRWNSSKDIIVDGSVSGVDFYILENIGNIYTAKTTFTPHHHGTKRWIWISSVAATLLIICISILFLALKKRKHVLEEKKRKEMTMKLSEIKDFEIDLKKGHGLKVFDYALVLAATNWFSSENKLGQGGFGPVYKGTLPTGEKVAIKRLSKSSTQGIVEFKNEVTLICELQHMNLVQLLGCCIHEEEKILIYEYMPNKSLDFYLFDCARSKLLDWNKRFNIIQGVAQGLLYLHKYSRLKIIHRDLKASNILLDENMNPKISDFGMARMFTEQESVSNTNRVVGTYGYMSPEYAMEGVFSTKSDVYSFGILLIEIVSGRKNTSFYDDDHPINLIGHVWELWKDDKCFDSVDPSLEESFDYDEVQRCIHVGLLCVEQYANDRPTMFDVISMLTNKSEIMSLPKRPAFYVQREMLNENLSSTGLCTASTVEITTSLEIE